MERVSLEVEPRTPGKSSAARALRRQGKIPGIFYGNRRTPEPIQVDARTLREALATGGGRHAVLEVVSNGARTSAILKEFQQDPVRDRVTHIDLYEVRADQEVASATAVVLVGEPEGVRMGGGVLDQPTVELAITARPADLPESIEVDVSDLGVGDSLKVADLTPPSGVVITSDPDLVIASITLPTQLEPEAEAGEEPVEGAEAEEGAATAESEAGGEGEG